MDAAEKLQGAQLDAEIAGLRQVYFRLCQSSVSSFFCKCCSQTLTYVFK